MVTNRSKPVSWSVIICLTRHKSITGVEEGERERRMKGERREERKPGRREKEGRAGKMEGEGRRRKKE